MFPDANLAPKTLVPMFLVSMILRPVLAEDIQPPPYNAREHQVTLGQRIALGFFATTTFGLTILVLYLRSEIARQTIRRLVGGLSAPLLGGGAEMSAAKVVALEWRIMMRSVSTSVRSVSNCLIDNSSSLDLLLWRNQRH